jgi:hypothetical protein
MTCLGHTVTLRQGQIGTWGALIPHSDVSLGTAACQDFFKSFLPFPQTCKYTLNTQP